MKENNKNVIKFFKILNLFIIVLIVINILLYFDFILPQYNPVPPYFITIFIVLLIYVTSSSGNQYYTIDTKGETISFETESFDIFSILNPNVRKMDLPKYKLVDCHYNNGIFSKRITFLINSRKAAGITKIRFRLGLVSNKRFNRIKNNIDQIVEDNKKQNNTERQFK